MPPGLSTFVGREDESARLVELVAAHRIVTVVGPGGIGKTRLADEVCARLGAVFAGGIRKSELAQVPSRSDIATEVAGPLGFPSLDSLVLGLGDAPSLLVLDNCEHLLARRGAPLRATARRDRRRCTVLATSREPLGVDGEQVLVLGPLALPATRDRDDARRRSATRLFDDRARGGGRAQLARRPQSSPRVAELCRRLDGVPLAIELAAARARSLTAVELLALLDRRFDLLQRATPVGRARHRSLRAAIDASYELLDPDEQRFFRALGVFAGPFRRRARARRRSAAGLRSPRTASISSSRLVDRSLVIAKPSRRRDAATGCSTRCAHYAAEQSDRGRRVGRRSVDRFVDADASPRPTAIVAARHGALVAGAARTLVLAQLRTWSPRSIAAIATRRRRGAARSGSLLPLWGAIAPGPRGRGRGRRASACSRAGRRATSRCAPRSSAVAASALLAGGPHRSARARSRERAAPQIRRRRRSRASIALRCARHRGARRAATPRRPRTASRAAPSAPPRTRASRRSRASSACCAALDAAQRATALDAALADARRVGRRARRADGDRDRRRLGGRRRRRTSAARGRLAEARAALASARRAHARTSPTRTARR